MYYINKFKLFIKEPAVTWFSLLTHLGLTQQMSDEEFLKKKFKAAFGYKLDLENPQTFNEKLQWLKLNDRKPEYTLMVDKYFVKKYVAEKIGEQYIIPTLGIYDHFDDIDFDKLPKQFVLKCTHDSGGLVIIRDKSKMNKQAAKKKLDRSLKNNFYYSNREWPYKNVPPKIICEKFMCDRNSKLGLIDYKFYCFNGKPQFLYISEGLENHDTAKISFLDLSWNFAPFGRSDYKPFVELPSKPKHYEEMIKIAHILADGIKFLRVDLYYIENQVYFSELTFTPCGGFMPFSPKKYDQILGQMLELT